MHRLVQLCSGRVTLLSIGFWLYVYACLCMLSIGSSSKIGEYLLDRISVYLGSLWIWLPYDLCLCILIHAYLCVSMGAMMNGFLGCSVPYIGYVGGSCAWL